MECKTCGSTNTVKNGRTSTGQQQYHCRACGVYTVTGDRARERAIKMEIVDTLHRERVSQRGMARVTGISRPTITRWLRKKSCAPSGRRSYRLRRVPRSRSMNSGRMLGRKARSCGTGFLPVACYAAPGGLRHT
jgi:transposase-like protein